jgi:hypothetical protein
MYVTAMCWRKMYRRITHWVSMGYIYLLAGITPEELRGKCRGLKPRAFKQPEGRHDPVPHPKNEALYLSLRALSESAVGAILAHFHPLPPVQVCGDINNLVIQLQLASEQKIPSAYNEKSCVEFHHLLVAVLLGYGRMLSKLHDADEYRKGEKRRKEEEIAKEDQAEVSRAYSTWTTNSPHQNVFQPLFQKWKSKKVEEIAERNVQRRKKELKELQEHGMSKEIGEMTEDVWIYTELLWRIVSSAMFKDHMEALKTVELSPDREDSSVYSAWVDLENFRTEWVHVDKRDASGGLAAGETGNSMVREPEGPAEGELEDPVGGEPEDLVGGGPEDLVGGGPEDPVEGEPEDSVEGEHEDSVEGEPEDSEGEPEDSVGGEPEDSVAEGGGHLAMEDLLKGLKFDADAAKHEDLDAEEQTDSDIMRNEKRSVPSEEKDANANTFKNWIRLNTSHLTALHRISNARLPKVHLSLILAEQPKLNTLGRLNWHDYLRDLAKEYKGTAFTFDAEDAITTIQGYVDHNKDLTNVSKHFGHSNNETPSAMAGEVLFSGNQHAESLMGALAKFTSRLVEYGVSPTLIAILEVRTCVNSTYPHPSERASIGIGYNVDCCV